MKREIVPKTIRKAYINITNRCDYSCPFCCMYSSTSINRNMNFDTFVRILKEEEKKTKEIEDCSFIIQFEGGEPTIHPNFILFLEYVANLDFVNEIIIDTNGKHLNEIIDKVVEIAERNRKLITIKPSINKYLLDRDKNLLKKYDSIASACEFIEFVNFSFNVRYMDDNEYDELMKLYGLDRLISKKYFKFTAFQFNAYGRMEGNQKLPKIKINNIYDNWNIYSTDGTCFKTDLVRRSEHERWLNNIL